MELIFLLIAVVALVGLVLLKSKYDESQTELQSLKKEKLEVLTLNTSIANENKKLEDENFKLDNLRKDKEKDYESLVRKISDLTNEVYDKANQEATEKMKLRSAALEASFSAKEETLSRDYRDRKEKYKRNLDDIVKQLDSKKQELETYQEEKLKLLDEQYDLYKELMEEEYEEILNDLSSLSVASVEKIKVANEELAELKAKQNAYIQEKLRQEQIAQQASFYKMEISGPSANDIKILRENVQPIFSNKDLIDKLIWEGFYKGEYDKLAARIFGGSTEKKVCGIYKITCLTTDKAYIGQSVSVRERFREHIKAGLAHTPSSNKLYSEMQNYGPENFTFELLEEVPRHKLDERESYWIDFYRTKDYGLNTQRGNGGK